MSNSTALVSPSLIVGDVISTMLVGHVVQARINKITDTPSGTEYEVDYLGGRLCLDLGEGWYVDVGHRFVTRPVNIARAAHWLQERESGELKNLTFRKVMNRQLGQ